MAIIVESVKIKLTLGQQDPPEVFTKEHINNFFSSLPDATDTNDKIYLVNCIGSNTCDDSIAINKGYKVLK